MARTALVVGGSGYVGAELCRHLRQKDTEVTVLGRSGKHLDFDCETIHADITNCEELNVHLNGRKFDTIFHVASLPGDTGDPGEMIRVNLLGLTHVLNYARLSGTKRFILSSSISAYEWYPASKFNPPEYLPVDEEHPCRPKDMYSCSKRMQEILALTFYHQYQTPVVILRLTAVVGPGGRGGGRGWREFAQQLQRSIQIEIPHFSLDEVCHYVDIRDVARMQLVAAEHPNAVGQIFNCCGPQPTSGREFETILKQLSPRIIVKTGFPWSMAQGGKIEFDMSKAKRLLQFEPIYSLKDSVLTIKEWVDGGGLEQSGGGQRQEFGSGICSSTSGRELISSKTAHGS